MLFMNAGITYKDGNLIHYRKNIGIQMINLIDESITNITNTCNYTFYIYSYITTFKDKLFYTNLDEVSVTCCDYHGNILWNFCDISILASPLGISVDSNGHVYVSGLTSDNVVVFFS